MPHNEIDSALNLHFFLEFPKRSRFSVLTSLSEMHNNWRCVFRPPVVHLNLTWITKGKFCAAENRSRAKSPNWLHLIKLWKETRIKSLFPLTENFITSVKTKTKSKSEQRESFPKRNILKLFFNPHWAGESKSIKVFCVCTKVNVCRLHTVKLYLSTLNVGLKSI